jgi:uncharacterized protein
MPLTRILSAALVALPLALNAQLTEATDKPHIDVTGTAEMKVVPNEIYIAVELRERGNGDNKRTIEDQEITLKKMIVTLGIDASALTVTDAFSDYRGKVLSSDKVIGSKWFELKVCDAEKARKVFMELDRLKVETANVTRTGHSKITEYRRQMRVQAIKAAKEKANYLLEALEVRAGAPLIVREEASSPYGWWRPNALANVNYEIGGEDYTPADISFTSITVSASVFVRFCISEGAQ